MAVELNLDDVDIPDDPSVVFTLDGREWACKNRAAIPARAVDSLLTGAPIQLGEFYRAVLVDTDGDAFIELLNRADSPLTLTRSQTLARTLTEAIMNRPTLPSTLSQPGRRTTGGTSRGVSSSPATGRKKRAG